jgi:hypothetical protein
MVFAWAGHGSPSSTLSKDVGSVGYSIASPDLATRPHTALFRAPPGPGHFLISFVIPSSFSPSFLFFPCPPHHIPRTSGDLLASTREALKRAVSSNHSLAVRLPPSHVWHAPSFLLAPGPRPIPTLFPTGLPKVSALADWFLYLEPSPCVRLTHRPDDGGSKDLWNFGKLLPDYMALQPRRQPSSNCIQRHVVDQIKFLLFSVYSQQSKQITSVWYLFHVNIFLWHVLDDTAHLQIELLMT